MTRKLTICFASDDNYAPYMGMAIFSILKNAAKHTNWTLSIFGRYLIPQLISDDKVLYLDCDVMARGSLWDLWQTDLTNYYLAGVPDYNVMHRGRLKERFGADFKVEEYVNSGVLLINNKKWRGENLFETLLDYSIKNASLLQWPDQDAINFICRKHKKLLLDRYNVMGRCCRSICSFWPWCTAPRRRTPVQTPGSPGTVRGWHPSR